jgi:hypothetical protein
MMYSQGLKRMMAAKSNVVQLLIGSTRAAGLVQHKIQPFSVYNAEVREFSKKTKKGFKKNKLPGEVSDAELTGTEEDAFTAAAQPAQEQEDLNLDKTLFQPYSLGDVKKIQSTPDHQPPSKEDTIPGRYATVLFTTASQQGALYDVFEDMKFLGELYKNSESFQLFTQNAGIGMKEIRLFNTGLQEAGDYHPVTIRFLEVLAENKRLMFIKEISDKYGKLYQQFNKEEKITVISAYPLS